MKYFNRIINSPKAIIGLFLFFALLATLLSFFPKEKIFEGRVYTNYNNYLIFKESFNHLIQGKDLYILYPEEHWDLYKYSPTFSLFFGVFSVFPDFIGLSLWNILNAGVLLFSIYYLPKFDLRVKGLILISLLIELMTSMQNEQSNGLIAGLIILSYGLLERKKFFMAAFCILCTAYIKLFGILALVLFIFYPNKFRNAIYVICLGFVLLVLPLVVVDIASLKFLYSSWKNLLLNDHSASDGLSVLGWLRTWFNWEVNKSILLISGAVVFCLPLFKIKQYSDFPFRLLMLSSLLIWIVIFNHKAESPTFIIAMSGVCIWFFSQKRSTENIILFTLAFVFTSLSPTDIFPRFIKNEFVKPYVLKAVFCIFIWVKIIYEMMFDRINPLSLGEETKN